jgi:hypothetical protein
MDTYCAKVHKLEKHFQGLEILHVLRDSFVCSLPVRRRKSSFSLASGHPWWVALASKRGRQGLLALLDVPFPSCELDRQNLMRSMATPQERHSSSLIRMRRCRPVTPPKPMASSISFFLSLLTALHCTAVVVVHCGLERVVVVTRHFVCAASSHIGRLRTTIPKPTLGAR